LPRFLAQGAFACRFVRGQHLENLFTGVYCRMESNRWLLVDERDALAANLFQFASRRAKKVLAFKKYRTPRNVPLKGKFQEAKRQGCSLPETGFSKDTENLVGHVLKTYPASAA